MLVAVVVGLFVFLTCNPDPDDFYDPPDDVDAAPGTILRSEEFDQGIPEGARAWRVLYASTDEHGEPIAVSGLVIAPEDAGPGPHPVLRGPTAPRAWPGRARRRSATRPWRASRT